MVHFIEFCYLQLPYQPHMLGGDTNVLGVSSIKRDSLVDVFIQIISLSLTVLSPKHNLTSVISMRCKLLSIT